MTLAEAFENLKKIYDGRMDPTGGDPEWMDLSRHEMDYWNTIIAADPDSIYAQNRAVNDAIRTIQDRRDFEETTHPNWSEWEGNEGMPEGPTKQQVRIEERTWSQVERRLERQDANWND